MNEYMIFLEKDAIEVVFRRREENPAFIDLELPRLENQDSTYFMFFSYFSLDEKDQQAVFEAAVLTYLFFEEQLQLLRRRGQTSLENLPKTTESIVESLVEDTGSNDFWGKNVLQSIADQNPNFLDFVIRYSQNTNNPIVVSHCFMLAYSLISLQLIESKETQFFIPNSCLQ